MSRMFSGLRECKILKNVSVVVCSDDFGDQLVIRNCCVLGHWCVPGQSEKLALS